MPKFAQTTYKTESKPKNEKDLYKEFVYLLVHKQTVYNIYVHSCSCFTFADRLIKMTTNVS
jgi:hypothetical protein